ncbi:basic salivary proline-rich protein 2-like, partial [Meles meles]|uniref:basic salivary proline-rich protein 2-like n=1 Tax=Meles meles TaxID=9662 RepID=UPI001E6A0ECC
TASEDPTQRGHSQAVRPPSGGQVTTLRANDDPTGEPAPWRSGPFPAVWPLQGGEAPTGRRRPYPKASDGPPWRRRHSPARPLPGGAAAQLRRLFPTERPLPESNDPTRQRAIILPNRGQGPSQRRGPSPTRSHYPTWRSCFTVSGDDPPLQVRSRGEALCLQRGCFLAVRPLQDGDDPTPVKMLPSQAVPLQRDPFLAAGEAPSRLPVKTLPREPIPDGEAPSRLVATTLPDEAAPWRCSPIPETGGDPPRWQAMTLPDCGKSPYSTATSDHPTRRGRSPAERPLPGGEVASQQQRPYPTESDDPTQRGRSQRRDTFLTASEAPPFPNRREAALGAALSPAGKLFPDTRQGPFPTAQHLAGGDDPPPRRAKTLHGGGRQPSLAASDDPTGGARSLGAPLLPGGYDPPLVATTLRGGKAVPPGETDPRRQEIY